MLIIVGRKNFGRMGKGGSSERVWIILVVICNYYKKPKMFLNCFLVMTIHYDFLEEKKSTSYDRYFK
jgi:hypothetical protein